MNETQRYAVYHANHLFEGIHLPSAMRWYADRSKYYTHVADVEAPLGQVFALTNHIDHPWTNNPGVVCSSSTLPVRSTSVGDVIVSLESGQAWLVMPIGLQELVPEHEQLTENSGGREDSRHPSVEKQEDCS